jgi:ribonuclease HI
MHTLFCDGACDVKPGNGSFAYILLNPENEKVTEYFGQLNNTTNNRAEYWAVINGLTKTLELNVKEVLVKTDSLLVVNQVNESWKVKDEKLKPLRDEILELKKKFNVFEIEHINRELNKEADKLAKKGLK